jgi:hypothetical protein
MTVDIDFLARKPTIAKGRFALARLGVPQMASDFHQFS